MSVLVTGATGFIGNALIRRLVEGGTRVVVLARDKRAFDNLPVKNIRVHQGDITQPNSLMGLDTLAGETQTIFHLAASLDYFGKKEALFRVNVEGTSNLMEWAVKQQVSRFIFTSSVEAIGPLSLDDLPADESYPCRPVSAYGLSKLSAEKQVAWFASKYGFQASILRLGNVYGPGSRALILPIAKGILEKRTLLRHLPTYANRYLDPVFLDDVVEGLLKAWQLRTCGIYILSGDSPVTVGELFAHVAEALNVQLQMPSKSRPSGLNLKIRSVVCRLRGRGDLISYLMAGKAGRIHRAYSIARAQKDLGYSPKASLKEGLTHTMAWLKEERLIS